jgi:hypothetical protein
MNNVLLHFITTTGFLAVMGCSGGEAQPVAVHGAVHFHDGAVPRGEIAMIRLEPMANEGRPAIGDIHEDGTFELSTVGGSKGVLPGKYKVTLKVFKTYERPRISVVAAKYDRAETSDIEVDVGTATQEPLELKVDHNENDAAK